MASSSRRTGRRQTGRVISRRTAGRQDERASTAARRQAAARRLSRQRAAARRPRRASAASYQRSAQRRLKRFRQGSILAVAFTGLFLLVGGVTDVPAQDIGNAAPEVTSEAVAEEVPQESDRPDPAGSVEEATGTLRQLAIDFTDVLPRVLLAVALLFVAAMIVKAVRFVLRRVLGSWERAEAATAMAGVVVWLLAIGVALSVVAGDARALLGSVGLLGLALSWALQAPIESFAGWLLNSFKGYYRVGDRIGVGEVFGDVYRIDFLNTTVWEAGGPDKPVQGAQPTGALITFPNSEVLRANIVNYTRGFPYVWDEVVVGVANESDRVYAMRIIADVAKRVVGPAMVAPVQAYRTLLEKEGLGLDIAEEPQVYFSMTDSWSNVTVRYLVNARERRKWSSMLLLEIETELTLPEHSERLKAAYPVTRLELPADMEAPRDTTKDEQ